MNERPSIDKVLDLWKADCGEVKTSSQGTTYLVIPLPDRRGRLLDLIQALVSYGHLEEDIRSGSVSSKVVKMCWSDLIVKMTAKDLKRNRDITRHQWEEALNEFFKIELPKYVKKVDPLVKTWEYRKDKPDRLLEVDPSDRIRLDTSDVPDAPLDLDFLEELGIDESSVGGNNE